MPLRITSTWTSLPRCIARRALCPPRTIPRSRPALLTRRIRHASTTVEAPSAPGGTSDYDAHTSEAQEPAPRSNFERNQMFRHAFKHDSPDIRAEVDKMLSSPYVPDARKYPSPKATKESLVKARRSARRQVAHEIIANEFGQWLPTWQDTLGLLKTMTQKKSELPSMTAVRIILSKSWELGLSNKKLEFVDSSTGLMAKLRVSADQKNESAVILRGQNTVLARAVEDLLRVSKDIQIYQLGEVAVFDYEAKQLWPVIENAPDGGTTLPVNMTNNIWMHEEIKTYWIDTPYEDTLKPSVWTSENFEEYVTTLVSGRLHPHLVVKHYGHMAPPEKINSDSIRIDLIMKAFHEPSAAPHITNNVLKMALAFISQKGGHRAAADRLFTMAETLGIPLDTDTFNIILRGYLTKRDPATFHRFLLKMKARYFYPNARTWLLFLDLVEKDNIRRQVIVAIFETGLFDDPTTRRGIAKVMATHDAHVAFKAGRSLESLMAGMSKLYGEYWLTAEAKTAMLEEFFMFYTREHEQFESFKSLVDCKTIDGYDVGIRNLNLVLHVAIVQRDWSMAMWALERFDKPGSEMEPDRQTYHNIIMLSIVTQCSHALSLAFFYGVHFRKIAGPTREVMGKLLTGRLKDAWWKVKSHRPKIFTNKMASALVKRPGRGKLGTYDAPLLVVSAAERAILNNITTIVPKRPLAAVLESARRTMDRPMHKRNAARAAAAGADLEAVDKFVVKEIAVKMMHLDKEGTSIARLEKFFDPVKMLSWRSGEEVTEASFDVVEDWQIAYKQTGVEQAENERVDIEQSHMGQTDLEQTDLEQTEMDQTDMEQAEWSK